MLTADLMLPLPPGTVGPAYRGDTKEVVSLHYCLHCGEWALVKVEASGRLYAYCSRKEITIKGCNSEGKAPASARPVQTFEEYQRRLAEVSEKVTIQPVYQQYLDAAWAAHAGEVAS